MTFTVGHYTPYKLSHWSIAPCVLTAWLAALLA
jgi:hypothetical protein